MTVRDCGRFVKVRDYRHGVKHGIVAVRPAPPKE